MNKKDIKSLLEAVEKSPDNIALRLTLALKQFKLKQYEDSEKNYLAVLKIDPENVKAKQGLIDLYFVRENYSAVIVLGEELVNKNMTAEKTLEVIAKSYLRQDNIKDAQEIYEKMVKRNPFYFDEELDSVLDDGDYYNDNFDDYEDDEDGYDMDDGEFGSDFPFGDMPESLFPFNGEELLVKDFGFDFEDIVGLDDLKDLVRLKMTFTSLEPVLANSFGFQSDANILLYGPPGCGKTLFAKAIPAEFDCKLLPIGADLITGVIDKQQYLLHSIFRLARSKNPCVLFFDDVDFLAFNRGIPVESGRRESVSRILSELDGIYSLNEDLVIIMASGAPWMLDSSLIRSGRTDYCFFVAPPNYDQRLQYFKRTLNPASESSEILLPALAEKTAFYSYADLRQIFTWVVDKKMLKVMKQEEKDPKLTGQDFFEVIEKFKPGTEAWVNDFLQKVDTNLRQTRFYMDVLEYAEQNKLI